MLAKRIDPEVIGQLRIAGGNVASHAFVETEAGEKTKRSGQLLFPVLALLSGVGESRRLRSTEGRGVCSGHGSYYNREAGNPAFRRHLWCVAKQEPPRKAAAARIGCPTWGGGLLVTLSLDGRQDVRAFQGLRGNLPCNHCPELWHTACLISTITSNFHRYEQRRIRRGISRS
jgi:hypothetical protein